MALTRAASKVGLSISTQGLSPASMVSASNGSLVMSMVVSLAGRNAAAMIEEGRAEKPSGNTHARPCFRQSPHLRCVRHRGGLAHLDRARERTGAQAEGPRARLARLRGRLARPVP